MDLKNKVIRRRLPVVIKQVVEQGWEFADRVPAGRIEHLINAFLAAGAEQIMYSPASEDSMLSFAPRFDFFYRGR